MNVDTLRKSGFIIFETIVGSRAYGTAIDTISYHSDIDKRGIFVLPLQKRISIHPLPDEVGQEKPEDVKFYELAKFVDLAKGANPNVIEYLFMPDECVLKCTPKMQRLLDIRQAFISKRAYHTFTGYSVAQIKKAKGQNKLFNSPQPEAHPKREDFCWIAGSANMFGGMPFRPVRISDMEIPVDLSKCHVSSLEHTSNVYRLYRIGSGANGVFRGGNLVCESISIEDEANAFYGLLIYNKSEYEKACADWKNYWTWMKERNPNRWITQETGQADCDLKNMQHCVRLLLSGKSILETGKPIVRFEGEQLRLLRDIREGKFKHAEIMEMVDGMMADIDIAHEKSDLPWGPDLDTIDNVYRELVLS